MNAAGSSRAFGHRQEGTHAQPFAFGFVQHAHVELLVILGQVLGRAGQIARRANIGGLIREIARERHAADDGFAMSEAALGLTLVAATGDGETELDQRRLGAFVAGLVIGNAVLRGRDGFDGDASLRVRIGVGDFVQAQIADRIASRRSWPAGPARWRAPCDIACA